MMSNTLFSIRSGGFALLILSAALLSQHISRVTSAFAALNYWSPTDLASATKER
jgi:hypothetical protein